MRKEYKEIFDVVQPDTELVSSVTENFKRKEVNVKPAAVFFCLVAVAVCLISAIAVKSKPSVSEMTDNVTVMVAYETGKNTQSMQHIKKVISAGGKEITIDADVVIDGNANDMCVYSATSRLFSENKILDTIIDNKKLYAGEKDAFTIGYPLGGGITFNVSETKRSYSNRIKGDGYARGCDISYSEAREISDMFVEKYGVADFNFVEGNIADTLDYGRGYSSTGKGFYAFRYYQFVDGFPLETVTSNVYSGVSSLLDIFVNDEGITYLRMCGLDLQKKKELHGNIISLDKAIEMIEGKLTDLWLSEYAPIVEIRLEYMLDQGINGETEITPCWHFCIDQTKIKSLPTDEQRKNDTNDLCVKAVTGEFFRVADRYPVYLTKDGIVSTWDK